MRRTQRGGWPYSQPPNTPFEINRDSPQADGLVLWMPWGGGTPGAHRHVDRVNGLVFTEGGTPVWVADGERGWAMLFDDGANEYLTINSTIITAPPFTIAASFYTDDDTVDQAILCIGASAFQMFDLFAEGTFNNRLTFRARSGGANQICRTTTSFTANTWHRALAVARAADDRAVLIDGGSKGTNAVDVTPVGVNKIDIGSLAHTGQYFSGRIADARFYNRAFSDAEAYEDYRNPWELYRPIIRRWVGWKAPTPPATIVPVAMHHYRSMRL